MPAAAEDTAKPQQQEGAFIKLYVYDVRQERVLAKIIIWRHPDAVYDPSSFIN